MLPRTLRATLLTVLASSPVQPLSAQPAGPVPAPARTCLSAKPEQKAAAGLVTAEDARFAAQVAGNVAKVSEGLADELIYVHAMGMRQTKADYLAALASGKSRYSSISASGRAAQVCGPIGWTRAFYTIVTGNRTLQSSYLAVYIWRAGRWQLLSWQTTPPRTEEVGPSKPALYQPALILTHEDGFWRFSARSARRDDVVSSYRGRDAVRGAPEAARRVAIPRPLDFVAALQR